MMPLHSDSRPHKKQLAPEKLVQIKVVGVGGAGVNAVDRLVLDGFSDVKLLAINTDVQALASSVLNDADKLQIGENLTKGLGAGGDPQIGRAAAKEDVERIRDLLKGYDLVFLAAGMGGGTGTGAGPIVARVAREEGALVLALITLPFSHEGKKRTELAKEGVAMMKGAADGVICIPNDQLLGLAGEETSVLDAFRPTDDFLSQGVRKIWQLLARTGLINIDFADLRMVLKRRNGETLFGFGEGSGKKKLEEALEMALGSPLLLDHPNLVQSTAALIGVTHGPDFTMAQLKRLMEGVHQRMGVQTICKQGIVVDETYADRVALVVIASTGEAVADEEISTRECEKVVVETPIPRKDPSRDRKASAGHGSAAAVHSTSAGEGSTPFRIVGRKKLATQESGADKARQETLKLDLTTHGLFERVERTILNGEDLDRPTFIRRGIRVSDLK